MTHHGRTNCARVPGCSNSSGYSENSGNETGSPISNGVLDAACAVDRALRELGLSYCVIGGIALQRWGEPRTTLDVDVTVLAEFGDESSVIDQLLSRFDIRINDARTFALENRILLLKESGVGVDVSLGALPFEFEMMVRASDWKLGHGQCIHCCCAEDLVIQKAFAGRPQDWVDIKSILTRQSSSLNQNLIQSELAILMELKPESDALERLQRMIDEA